MSRVKTYRFGPGSLEAISLRVWRVPGYDWRMKARVTGIYTVYCGSGWEHNVEIDETIDAQIHQPTGDIEALVKLAYESGQDAAGNLAAEMVEYALADWSDPCYQGSA